MSKDKNTFWRNYGLVVIVSFIVLFFVLAICATIIWGNKEVKDDSIIIGFFGILATFVVIGNYSQVINIKNDIFDESRDSSLISKVNQLYDATGKPKYESEITREVSKQLDQLKNDYNQDLKAVFDFIIKSSHSELMSIVLANQEYVCTIKRTQTARRQTARAKIEGNEIVFRDYRRDIIDTIYSVNDSKYDKDLYNRVVRWWKNNDPIANSNDAIGIIYGQRNNA